MQESSAIVVRADELRMSRSHAVVVQGRELHGEGEVHASLLQAGNVETKGDIRALVVMAGNVKAGGNVSVKFDATSASALGAGFALALVLLRKLWPSR